MSTPSKAFHGCFGHHQYYFVGKFVGGASNSDSEGEWTTVVRNKKGVKQSKKQANEISNFKVKKVPKGAHLIDLAVAPKVNDQTHQNRAQQKKKTMSYQGKSVKKPHVEVLDALSMSKFQKLLSDIKKAESDLTKESDIINQNLGILQTSVQQSTQLLLVKKGLYWQFRAFQLTRLPKTWNEFWLKKLPRVPTTDEPNQNDLMHKVLDKQIDHIDGERNFVGDLDLKVFHAINNKKQLDNHQGKIVIDWENLPDVAFSSDSDKSSIWNDLYCF
jgi:G:T-mismatch repair DNA endonuclease (very short patch repair protein)